MSLFLDWEGPARRRTTFRGRTHKDGSHLDRSKSCARPTKCTVAFLSPFVFRLTIMSSTLEYASHAPEPFPRLKNHHVLPSKMPDYLRLILTSKVYELVRETPLVFAPNLSAKFGNEIWLKREDLQDVFSFKIRGAYNFMAHLSEEERWKGVITCSAG
jgi:hypothetical protein